MTIDKKALEAACAEFKEHLYIPGKTSTDERVAIQAAIEAYEAARPEPNPWRPLSEADIQEREKIEIWSKKGWWIAHWFTGVDGERYWRCGPDDIWTPEQLVAAVFRTIDPPQQDGDCCQSPGPSAAEGG